MNEDNTKNIDLKIAELEADLNFYHTLLNNSNDWKFFQDHNGKILFSNASVERIAGFKKDDFLAYKFSIVDILHPDDKESFQKSFQAAFQGQVVDSYEHRVISLEQNIVYCETSIIPVFSNEQKFAGICISLKDVSKRKLKEQGILNRLSTALIDQQATHQQLLTHEKILKRLGANLKNGAIFQVNTGPDGFLKFTYISEGADSIYGHTSEELINDSSLYFSTIHQLDYENANNLFNHGYPNGQINYYERIINAKTGETKWTYVIANPSVLEEGLICWDGIVLDHTELKNAEMVLKQSNQKIN